MLFRSKLNLPISLYAFIKDQKIPEDLEIKIKNCKKNGGIKYLRFYLDNMMSMSETTEDILKNLQSELHNDEEEDESFWELYKGKSKISKNSQDNERMFKELEYYWIKLKSAKEMNLSIKNILKEEEHLLKLIDSDKSEIMDKIPKRFHINKFIPSFIPK